MSHLGECYFNTAYYKQKYQHHLNCQEPTLVSISTLTSSPSSVASTSFVSSTITTASAPGGTGAPVLILITCQKKRQNKKLDKSRKLERKEKGKPLLKQEAPYEGKSQHLLLHEPGRQTNQRTTN